GGEPRAAIAATLADGAVVWCTHLGLRDEWRATQTETLAAAIGPPPMEAGLPVLLAGDFNAPVEAGEIQQLLAQTGLHAQGEDDGPTFPSATPLVRIDHLLARGVVRLDSGVRADSGSDHYLIWADLEWPSPQTSALR
ncbi:MAG: endonuclease/exonuclease/phosphatase family protein, partial [Cytophagales bacterium]|nr:endonuclease/exonuclease/phosphatase family protein [Armatimonadota bacterium]